MFTSSTPQTMVEDPLSWVFYFQSCIAIASKSKAVAESAELDNNWVYLMW